jgi:hypothetical protein
MLARSDNVTPMRVALVSDIHGNLPALEAVVADIRRRGADQIVCIGDDMFPCHGTPDAQYAIVEKSRGGWMYEHYAVIYDSAPMAALARARGRPDWEQSLLRGYVR